MKEFLESTRETLNNRLKNPIIGGFFLSWMIFNWKFILVLLFSNAAIEDRIGLVQRKYINLLTGIVYPLVTAALIFIALPYLMAGLEFMVRKGKEVRKKRTAELDTAAIRLEILKVEHLQALEDKKAKYEDREAQNKKLTVANDLISTQTHELQIRDKEIGHLREALAKINIGSIMNLQIFQSVFDISDERIELDLKMKRDLAPGFRTFTNALFRFNGATSESDKNSMLEFFDEKHDMIMLYRDHDFIKTESLTPAPEDWRFTPNGIKFLLESQIIENEREIGQANARMPHK